jgi:beta-fructofuranosidase
MTTPMHPPRSGIVLLACELSCALAVASPANSAPAPRSSTTAFLYQPETGVLADVIPFFWKGQYHLLYLQLKPGQLGFDWAQVVTRDFTSYRYTGVAIPSGGKPDSIDLNIFTGSVIEKDGVLYAFYTGHNQEFAKQKKNDQLILRAKSVDGVQWTKEPGFRLTPEGNPHYRIPGACRDPFLFWNPQRNEYGMVFCATPVHAGVGGLAYAGSADLEHWRLDEPLSASGRFPGYECPDVFRWGDRWYLLFSTYGNNPGWATRYMSAPGLEGPWLSPADDFLDGGSLYAAKSASDGKRRFLCGTLPQRNDKRDDGENGWGGRLLAYEMVLVAPGRLGVRIPPEVEESFGTISNINVQPNPDWETRDGAVRSKAGQARIGLGKLADRCLVSAQITVPPTGRAGLWLGGDERNEKAFRVFVDVATQRVVWDHGELPLGSNPERERPYRPLQVRPGDRVTLKVALDGDAAVACVNDNTCMAFRMYDRRQSTFGIWSDTVGAEFRDVQARKPAR